MSKERRRPIEQHDIDSGARVRELRKLDFGTQKKMGDFLGISESYVSRIEKGDRRLMPDDRFKLTKKKMWSMKYIDFGLGPKHLDKDYFKGSLVTDIGDLMIQMELLRNDLERYREENTMLLKMLQDLKEKVRSK